MDTRSLLVPGATAPAIGAAALALGAPAGASSFTIPIAGEAMTNVRDLDGDHVRDLVIGVPSQNLARVYSGRTGALLATLATPAGAVEFGRALANLGDVDADGLDDVAVGDPGFGDGRVHVYSGRPVGGALLQIRQLVPFVPSSGCAGPMRFGAALAAIGDWTGDGRQDLAVGAPGWSSAATGCTPQGSVEIVSVRAQPPSLLAAFTQPGCRLFGTSLTGLGDVDHDGAPDLVVGAPDDPFSTTNAAVIAYSGRDLLADVVAPLAWLAYPQPGNAFGWSIADVGDVDQDGDHDLVVGAPNFNLPSGQSSFRACSGRAIGLASGGAVPPLGLFSFSPVGKALGVSVSSLGDVNGDQRPDFLVGAGSPFNTTPGAIYVISGANFGIVQSIVATASLQYGQVVAPTKIPTLPAPGMMIADPGLGVVEVK